VADDICDAVGLLALSCNRYESDNHWIHKKSFPMCEYQMVSKYTATKSDESPIAGKLAPIIAKMVWKP
jgi:hypothetical protein